MALIACVDLDPFLVGLVRKTRPDDEVVELDARDLGPQRRAKYAAFVAPAGVWESLGVQTPRLAERTVLVVGGQDGAVPADHPGPAVRRPVEATDLRQALARVVPSGRLDAFRRRVQALPVATSADGVFAIVRVATVAGASALALTDNVFGPPVSLLVALFAWTLVRVWVRDSTVGLVAADGVWTGAVLLAGAGATSSFVLLAAVVAAEVGYTFPSRVGAIVVGVATLLGMVSLAFGMRAGTATISDLIGWGALLPLASVIGVLTLRVQRETDGGTLHLLRELHATLDRLSKQAQGVAGTLDVGSVVEQTIATVREDLEAMACVLLLGDGEVLTVAGSFGHRDAAPPRVAITPTRRDPGLPSELVDLLPDGDQIHAPLSSRGVDQGLMVVVVPSGQGTREATAELERLAAEVTVAIENARLFEKIQELTVDEERRRLARDLHDGVVQSLVHVRFELDLVRRLVATDQTEEIERLRDVVGQAVDEVRATVNDLRSVRLTAGLGTALLSLAREYERPDLRVVVDPGPVRSLTPEAELQLLRIAQEAVSNAVHHGKPSLVYVRLWEATGQVHLQVLDDGVGITDALDDPSRGVGLRAMQERADLLGAALDLGPGADGGTCVQVDVPVERTEP